MQIYLIFDLINVNDKYSPWDRDQIVIKLGTEHIIYEKLENLIYKKDIHVNRLIWYVNVYFIEDKKSQRGT